MHSGQDKCKKHEKERKEALLGALLVDQRMVGYLDVFPSHGDSSRIYIFWHGESTYIARLTDAETRETYLSQMMVIFSTL